MFKKVNNHPRRNKVVKSNTSFSENWVLMDSRFDFIACAVV